MELLEKKQNLEKIFDTLKSEFIGLDSILNEIKLAISPWYLTPEVINKPVVISLWGMTGTGKSSVVKRLIELLDYEDKSLVFDCGLESGEGSSGADNISESIVNKIGLEDFDGDSNELFSDMIFVFDEFQYARTIDEAGIEITKPSLRPLWEIIDNGDISINFNRYEITRVLNLVDDLNNFIKRTKMDPKVEDGYFIDSLEFDFIKSSIELRRYYNNRGSIIENYSSKEDEEEDVEKKDEESIKESIFEDYYFGYFIKKLNTEKNQLGYTVLEEINSAKNLSKILEIIKSYKKYVLKQRILKCNKSLIFILGNLDEAFGVSKDFNPDYDADVFKDITTSVSISDIKEALKKRFRAEQIARFGNNIIKYPTLSKGEFIEIIKKETGRISSEFKKNTGIDLVLEEGIIKLLYSEGVYPVQGVRPVFTTIGLMITPFLSDIVLEKGESDTMAIIRLKDNKDLEKDFKVSETKVEIYFPGSEKVIEKTIKLQLGDLRDPKKKKTRYITSVHESGHAILSMYLKGEYPVSIVSVSTDNGGFCDTHVKSELNEIDCREDIDNEVMICLGGYLAEKLVFGENPEKCLMGSGSDLDSAWNTLSSAIYSCGYLMPIQYSNYRTETNRPIPTGLDLEEHFGEDKIRKVYLGLMEKAMNILNKETKLLKEMSLYLGEHGSLPLEKLKEMVNNKGNKITAEYMERRRRELSGEYYFNKLMELL